MTFTYDALPIVLKRSLHIDERNMSEQPDTYLSDNEGEQRSQQRLQMINTLKAPIIEMGRNLGYEVVENYGSGAGPIHVCWTFKPGS